MNVGSLFSGAGGLDLGLERAGFTISWQVENDPFCNRVLARHWPDVPRYGDIHSVDWAGVAPVDLVCGGFPCQPVSIAGKRGDHTTDARWLWPEFARCIGALRPDHILVENVVGLLARGFGDVLGDLAALGYDAGWDCLPASAVGAPHRRVRLFILGSQRDIAHDDGQRRQEQRRAGPDQSEAAWLSEPERGGWWATEPDVGRVVDGIPTRVDRSLRVARLKGLGNAVVPQVAEWIGRRIMKEANRG